jgi:osmotically-inducible protein OsmY
MRYLLIVPLALSLALAAGCTREEKTEVREEARGIGQQLETAAENAREAAANAALEAKVKSALATRKGLDATEINVEARGTVVTLKGDVAARPQAELAEQVALETEGVTAVNNHLMLRVPATAPGPS